jgi:hypothetical protein
MHLSSNPEYWLRGPVAGIPPLLQPVAHALLQSRDEVNALMEGFPAEVLWDRPGGVASPGFHLQHLAGVLAGEGRPSGGGEVSGEMAGGELDRLLKRYNRQIDNALLQLTGTPELSLTEPRGVGRARIPSTVGGLLFHAAEHSMRHTGQLLVTVRILQSVPSSGNR